MTNTHRTAAHAMINRDIDNARDELHDRALDDYCDMIDPHLDALRALCIARHDIACDDMTPLADDSPDTLDDAIDAMTDTEYADDAPCLLDAMNAISALLYSYYRD